tara:strand:- start:136 stop:2232 length:2097 start_codon:yes stop_codon:yes gene_type:complete
LIIKKQPSLSDPITSLTGIGPRLQERLMHIGIDRIQDLLFHLPYRYIDRTRLISLGELKAGEDAYFQGEIELTQIRYGKRRSLLCRISDGTGAVILRFFYFSKSQQNKLQRGQLIRCYGKVRRGSSSLEIIHPEYRLLESGVDVELEKQLTAVYPSTEGLQQPRIRKLIEQALVILNSDKKNINELLPQEILLEQDLPTLADALEYVHRAPITADLQSLIDEKHPTQKRLIIEELLAHQLSLLKLRNELKKEKSPIFNKSQYLVSEFLKKLSFKLTNAQKNAFKIIASDLNANSAMLRLLQGDVGSGKTVIAALATLQVIEQNYQVAIMVPTELLAEQHYKNFSVWFEPLNIETVLLTGKLKKSIRNLIEEKLKNKKSIVVIGTHALFQESIIFSKLGLVIIDEQHRFGVHQRLALIEKGKQYDEYPHQLIMTATPIPRTLTMTAYADLDHSIIDELPPGRIPVNTSVHSNQRRNEIIDRIKNVCDEGRQVYWVCTLIDESESLQCETVVATSEHLKQKLKKINTGMIHGRMKANEKEAIMKDFKEGKINLLVATTVIEVGVDVPNASLMIIDNAERLGLSQLHQLRGRIGRGNEKSHCILIYQSPLSNLAKERLEIMRTTNDGFVIAEKDLELRGPGEVLGTRQAGIPDFRIANLKRDSYLLSKIQRIATQLIENNPKNVELLIKRWLGKKHEYSNV